MRRMLTILLTMLLLLPNVGLALIETRTSSDTQISATIEEAVTVFLMTEIQAQATQAADGWQRFLYEQGVAEITMNLEKYDVEKGKPLSVSFMIAGGLPNVKKQPKYEGDAPEWLKGVTTAMTTRDTLVKTSLTITSAEGGYTAGFAPKAEAALQKTVKGIADKARKAFADKTILAVIIDCLMPSPIAVPKEAPEELAKEDYQAAFIQYVNRNALDLDEYPILPSLLYGIKGYQLDVTAGPEAFILTYSTPNLDTLFDASAATLSHNLSYDSKAKEYDGEKIQQLLIRQIEQDMAAYRHSKASDVNGSYSFNFFELSATIHPDTFFTYDEGNSNVSLTKALSTVQLAILRMPDYPAVPNPKTGLVSGSSSGIRCIFKALDDGYARCVSVYNSETEELYSTLFVASGETATVKIPKETYYFIVGAGEVWYGENHLFSDFGDYFKTEDIRITGSSDYHTFNLTPKKDGNTETYVLDYSDLFSE